MRKRSRATFALSVAVMLVSAACSVTSIQDGPLPSPQSDSESAAGEVSFHNVSTSDVDRVVDVELSEFVIAADSLEFTPGETVQFNVTNTGVVEHELRLSNQARVDEHVGTGHAGHDEGVSDGTMDGMDESAEGDHDEAGAEGDHDEAGAEGDHDEAGEAEDAVLLLGAGESGMLVFTFPDNVEDYTVAVCLVPGHYEAGMADDISYSVDTPQAKSGGASDATADRVIDVELSEFAVELSQTEFEAGVEYTFRVTNSGVVAHELMLIAPHENSTTMEMEEHDEMAVAVFEADDLEPGATVEQIVVFPASGESEIEAACFVPGHYEAGMKTDITITG